MLDFNIIKKSCISEADSFIRQFLKKAPEQLPTKIIVLEKNHILLHAQQSIDYVYILLRGRIQAIDELTLSPYTFAEIKEIDIVGDYELFAKQNNYYVTLRLKERCTLIQIPAKSYYNWIKNDAEALLLRMEILVKNVNFQNRIERQGQFIDIKLKLLLYFRNEASRNTPIKIHETRQDLAQRFSCSIRTINRHILVLKRENFIKIDHGKIVIDAQQLEKINSYIEDALRKAKLTMPK